MTPRRRDLVVALSLANLCFLPSWGLLLLAPPYYVGRAPARNDYLGVVLDVLLLAALFFGAAQLVRRSRHRAVVALARVSVPLVLALPAYATLRAWQDDVTTERVRAVIHANQLRLLVLISAVLFLAARFRRAGWRALRLALVGAAPFALVTFGQATCGVIRHPHAFARAAAPLPAAGPGPRVVWIIFDELDQRLAFDHPAVPHPAFAALRDVSLAATDAFSPGSETMLSIPALLTGRLVAHARVGRGPGDLALTRTDGTVDPWRAEDTVFARARAAGHATHLVGWAHAYCATLAPVLTSCFARPSYYTIDGCFQTGSLWESAWENALSLAPWNTRRLHAHAFEELLAHARALAAGGAPGLFFLHLPAPHTPGIWDRAAGRFSWFRLGDVDGYLGNLALADRALATLRADMEAAGVWDRTTVIVSADHFWRNAPAYDGVLDARVPFLVKPAGSSTPRRYDGSIDTLATGDLVLAFLSGVVVTTDDVARWLDAHAAGGRSPY